MWYDYIICEFSFVPKTYIRYERFPKNSNPADLYLLLILLYIIYIDTVICDRVARVHNYNNKYV